MFSFFRKFKEGFAKTQKSLKDGLSSIFSKSSITTEDWTRFESTLYEADFGPEITEKILTRMKAESKADKSRLGSDIFEQVLSELLKGAEGTLPDAQSLQVAMILGINGVGKTTTIAKLGYLLKNKGQKVLLGSCDTFRAAADQQLKAWADRLDLECIRSHQGADAAAVGFDVCQAAIHRGYQWTLLDTAGRLHNKKGLIEELKKMVRVLKKCDANFPQHRWLVVDGSLGTNSITQAKLFHEAIGLTGIIITKLDGTSKGGALVGIFNALHIPIYFIGLGEKPEDLQPFSIETYVKAILGDEAEK